MIALGVAGQAMTNASVRWGVMTGRRTGMKAAAKGFPFAHEQRQAGDIMRIDIRNGLQSRPQVLPLFAHVYPENVLRHVVWRNVVSAPAEERVVLLDDADQIVACVGLIFRTGLKDECLSGSVASVGSWSHRIARSRDWAARS
jgi:hypothetical protein